MTSPQDIHFDSNHNRVSDTTRKPSVAQGTLLFLFLDKQRAQVTFCEVAAAMSSGAIAPTQRHGQARPQHLYPGEPRQPVPHDGRVWRLSADHLTCFTAD